MSSHFPDTSGNTVPIGSTHVYGNKVYKWNGSKWIGHSKFNASIIGEYRDYNSYTANTNITTVDTSSANFVEVDLVSGQNTEFVFTNDALEQNLLMKVNNSPITPTTPTWRANIIWSTGSAPTISSTTLIEFHKYNETWHGNVISENL